MRLERKVALITGGYGGMGRASARLFAKEGATVFIAGRNEERGDALVAEINEANASLDAPNGVQMPRRRSPPRLYLDPQRSQWVIRDGASFIRTGCAQADRHGAESRLAAYIGQKHTPQRGSDALIADVLLTYASEHLPYTATAKNVSYHVEALDQWWGDKRSSDVTARNCRAYAKMKTPAAARRDLETLRAAIGYWHREYGPLPSVPVVILPDAPEPRDKWLTRQEADRLIRATERTEHLKRFILLGLHTGSRSNAILSLTWDRIDFAAGVMMRRGYGETESKTKKTPPVRLGKRILHLLRVWRAMDGEHGKYVVHRNGKKIKQIHRAFYRAAKEAGVRASPHTLRHTRATWVMQDGDVPLWEAAGHLGMSLRTLQKYAKHSPDFQKRAAEV